METLLFFFDEKETKAYLLNETSAEVKKQYAENWESNKVCILTPENKKQIESKLKKLGFKEEQTQNNNWRIFSIKNKDRGVVYIFRQTHRPIYEIAREINNVWSNVYFGARPYLNAMFSLVAVTDKYGLDPATEIIQYFLANATSFRGAEARRIKIELMNIVASHPER